MHQWADGWYSSPQIPWLHFLQAHSSMASVKEKQMYFEHLIEELFLKALIFKTSSIERGKKFVCWRQPYLQVVQKIVKMFHCALVGGWMVQQHTYPVAPFSPSSQLDGISEGEINVFRASEKGVHAKRFMILLSSLLLQLQVSVSWRQIDYSLAIY